MEISSTCAAKYVINLFLYSYEVVFTLSTIGFNIKIFYILLIKCILYIVVLKDLNRRAIILSIQH